MSTASGFMNQFDDKGTFRPGDGEVDAVFLTPTGKPYPGKLHFKSGLCVRAEMQGGSPWAYPDDSPLTIQFTLDLGEQRPHVIDLDQGRIVRHFQAPPRPSKGEFLANLRRARNLYVHGRNGMGGITENGPASAERQARSAIWLTPKSVESFNIADFPELGSERQAKLEAAVQDFLTAVNQVPASQSVTPDQYETASTALQKLLEILSDHLPMHDEAKKVEAALQGVSFPPWLVNWDYEIGEDQQGEPAVRLYAFAEEGWPRIDMVRFTIQVVPTIRRALKAEGVDRWPYVHLSSVATHKAG